MSITVADCMRLPALREATVVAGKCGLDRVVSSVTVLEYADASVISDDLFLNHEMCITAFASIKDDVEAQCRSLCRMREVGIVVVVLYYIGIFVPYLDKRLIATADEIELPLVCMPSYRFDFRYGEVISDVMGAVFRDQAQDTYFVPEMLERVSQLPEHQRTIKSVLQMLSDRLHCSLLLADQDMSLKSEASWPMAMRWGYHSILKDFQENPLLLRNLVHHAMTIDNKPVYMSHAPVFLERTPTMHLFAIDEIGALDARQVSQAAELIELTLNIWEYTFEKTSPDALVKAILNDEPVRVREIAAQLNIETERIQSMWVLKESNAPDARALKQMHARRAAISKQFLHERHQWALVDTYQNAVVMFFHNWDYDKDYTGLESAYFSALNEPEKELILCSFNRLLTTRDVRSVYLQLEACFESLKAIFPKRRIFNSHDLYFVEGCMQTMQKGEPEISKRQYALAPLRDMDDYEDLVRTLSVYLLDADSNMQETGAMMYIHKNTVKYRINKIRKRLGCDISKMPEAAALYMAVALHRLMQCS